MRPQVVAVGIPLLLVVGPLREQKANPKAKVRLLLSNVGWLRPEIEFEPIESGITPVRIESAQTKEPYCVERRFLSAPPLSCSSSRRRAGLCRC